MSHANARLTVRGRMLIVERRRDGWRQAHIAAAMGVSRKCVRYWLHRFATEGESGLADRSSRPHRCPTKTAPEVEAKVVALRLAVVRYRRFWTEAENTPMRVETDKGRFQRGGDLVDHSLISARTRSATSFGTSTRQTPHRGVVRGPQAERE